MSARPLVRPPRLRPGDAVRVVAPSGPVPPRPFEEGLAVLAARYRVRSDEAVLGRHGFLSGSDEVRLDGLRAALAEPDTRAVVMARGGYGILRLLPHIDVAALRASGKVVVGFSDGTALLALCATAGIAAVHGPVVTQLGRLPEDDRAALFRLLEEPGPQVLLDGLESLVPGRVLGPCVGGNLEVFSRLLGTPFLPELEGAVLFIEDVNERPYEIDRLLTHLDLAGVFARVAGVVVGDFSQCVEPEATRAGVPSAAEVLEERLGRLAIPVVFTASFGHGLRHRALPYGIDVELDTRVGTLVAPAGVVA